MSDEEGVIQLADFLGGFSSELTGYLLLIEMTHVIHIQIYIYIYIYVTICVYIIIYIACLFSIVYCASIVCFA